MLEKAIRHLWDSLGPDLSMPITLGDAGLWAGLLGLHLLLAVATLGWGDRTVCDILRPIRDAFSIDGESLIEGVLDMALSIPRAVLYCLALYLRAYLLAARVVVWIWAAAIVGLLTPLALLIVIGLVAGFDTPVAGIAGIERLITFSFMLSASYWYWRFDGRRLALNLRNAWRC